ncbi:hypothetical protein CEUSTIGMA_g10224.t1 [Chlamydomonas eustigma]|uniref:Heme-binding protein 2 n=1 Tax=Chlamydomonas eustigma TaxID=1157962 RepID=A0A250XI97_9CHLO|nr:hypothetical protein CEUSTIGMA_g10224.t1 [Chlamydomonas eustigma]|eukprot:GAX82798.1 hypothetical protein CEUSTIGMA_g10224.t1 [Chlamydomonas eustigma]
MNRFLIHFVLIACFVTTRGALLPTSIDVRLKSPWFCHDLDCPAFAIEDDKVARDMELRNYAAAQWVSTNVSDVKYDEAVRTGFWRLFQYISGTNEEDLKIEMTAPVKVQVVPGAGPYCKSQFKISFFVPIESQGSAPKPTDSAVYLDDAPAARFFVYSYPGFTYESKMLDKLNTALAALNTTDYKYDASYFFTAGYDSPFRLINRHNEVWIPAL